MRSSYFVSSPGLALTACWLALGIVKLEVEASCPSDVDECDGVNQGALAPGSPRDALEYSIFMGMQYYGPPEPLSTYHAIAAAAKKLAPAPLFISVCCDHNDKGGAVQWPLEGKKGAAVPQQC